MKCRVSTSFHPKNQFPSSRDKTQERQPVAAVTESQRKAGNSVTNISLPPLPTIQETTDMRRQPITHRVCFACRLQHVIFSCRLARSPPPSISQQQRAPLLGRHDACSNKLTGRLQILAKSLIPGRQFARSSSRPAGRGKRS